MKITDLRESQGLKIGDRVCIKRSYFHPQGTVGEIVRIDHVGEYTLMGYTVKPDEFDVVRTPDGGARVRLSNELRDKGELTYFPETIHFHIDFSGRGETGHGSIMLEREDLEKVPERTPLLSINRRCLR